MKNRCQNTTPGQPLLEVLQCMGAVSPDLGERIRSQKNIVILRQWMKIAIATNSIEGFEEAIR